MNNSYKRMLKFSLVFSAYIFFGISGSQAQQTNAVPIMKYLTNNYSLLARAECDTCTPLVGKPLVVGKPISFAYATGIEVTGIDFSKVPGIIAPNFWGGGSPEIKGYSKRVAGMTSIFAATKARGSDSLYFPRGAKGVAVGKSGRIYTGAATIYPNEDALDLKRADWGLFSFTSTASRLPLFNKTSAVAFRHTIKPLISEKVIDERAKEIVYLAVDPNDEKIVYTSLKDPGLEGLRIICRINDDGEWVKLNWTIDGVARDVWGALAVDKEGSLYIADSAHHVIVKAEFDNDGNAKSWRIVAGQYGKSGFKNDEGEDALFNKPSGICVDEDGNIYVGDGGNNLVRKIDNDGDVTTFAGNESGKSGLEDDEDPLKATFNFPTAVAYNEKFRTLYVVDYRNKLIREIDRDKKVTTLAGTPISWNPTKPQKFFKSVYYIFAGLHNVADETLFINPTGLAIDPSGFGLYVSDGLHIKYVSTFQAVFAITAAVRIKGTLRDTLPINVLPPGIRMDNENGSFYGVPLTKWDPTVYTISVLNSRGMSLLNGTILFEVLDCPGIKDTVTETRTILQKELPYTWNGRTFNQSEDAFITLQTSIGCDSVVFMKLLIKPEITYGSAPYIFSLGQQIKPVLPTLSGSRAETFSVNPALPSGLTLNSETGEINGKPLTLTTNQPVPALGPKTPPPDAAPWSLEAYHGADITQVKISDVNKETVFENNTAFKSLQGSAGKGIGTAGAFSDFSALGAIKMFANKPYVLQLSNALSGPSTRYSTSYSLNDEYGYERYMNSYAVYIDYNRDGDFADDGERVYISAAPQRDAHSESFNLTVPTTAKPGVTKIRIYCVEASTTPHGYFFSNTDGSVGIHTVYRTTEQALSFYPFLEKIKTWPTPGLSSWMNFGEFEDYNIEIVNVASEAYVVTGKNDIGSAQSTINIAVNPPNTSSHNLTLCSTELPYSWNGLTFVASGAQTAHLVNQYGADSAATLNVTVKQATSSVINVAHCGSYTYQGKVYFETVNDTLHFTNAAGCDSSVVFRFRQKATTSTTNIIVAPAQLPYTWNGLTFRTAGTQSAKLTNREGCDSIAKLVLQVPYNIYYPFNIVLEVNKPMTAVTPQVEGGYPLQAVSVGFNEYTVSPSLPNGLRLDAVTGNISGTPTQLSPFGFYTVTLRQAGAIPAKFNLSVGMPTASYNTLSNCGPLTWNGVVYDKSTTASATLKNQYGFDSTANLVLSIRNPSSSITHLFATKSEMPLTWNGISIAKEGTKTIYLVNSIGCDSAVTVNVSVGPGISYQTPNVLAPKQPISPIVPQSTGGSIPSVAGVVSTFVKTDYLAPISIAIDAQDNSYVSNQPDGIIYKINKRGTVSTVDGIGKSQALLAVDKAGNIFIADQLNNRIVKKDSTGNVALLANASSPRGIAIDSAGNVYFSEGRYHRIRKINRSGIVSTLAGGTIAGYADGNGAAARFNMPSGLSVDNAGNVYVADLLNNRIRKITPVGDVTSFAGNGAANTIDGIKNNAAFNAPIDIAADGRGNKYVVDNGSSKIRKIDAAGMVSTLAGTTAGYKDTLGSQAKFNSPVSITTDGHGQVYIADKGNAAIRQINAINYAIKPAMANGLHFDEATGIISGTPTDTLPEPETYTVYAFNKAGADTFKVVLAVCNPVTTSFTLNACDRYVWNDSIYTSSTTHTRTLKNRGGCDSVVTMHLTIRKGSVGATTTATACGTYEWKGATYDKTGVYTKVYTNAVGCDSTLYLNLTIKPVSVNNLFVNINPLQLPYSWRGKIFAVPGTQSVALVNSVGCDSIVSMTVRISNMLPNIKYATNDTTFYWERKLTVPVTMTSTGTPIPTLKLAERDTLINFSNRVNPSLAINSPATYIDHIVKGPNGTYYATVINSNQIFTLGQSGVWTVFAGTGGSGSTDGPRLTAKFGQPRGLAFDDLGNLFVAAYSDGTIRKITPDGTVSTLTVFPYTYGPNALSFDADKNLVVQSQGKITKINLSTNQSVESSMDYSAYFGSGELDMKTDSKGNIYILPNTANGIVKIKPGGQVVKIGKEPSVYQTFKPGNGPDAEIPSWIGSMAIDSSNDNLYLMAFGQLLRVDTSENVSAVTGQWFGQLADQIFRVDSGKLSVINNHSGGILYTANVHGIGSLPFMDNYGANNFFQPVVNFRDFDRRIRLDSTGAIVGTPRPQYTDMGNMSAYNTSTTYSIVAANQDGITNVPMVIRTKTLIYHSETFVAKTFPFVWRGRSFNAPTDTATYLAANKTLANDTLYKLQLIYEGPTPAITATGGCVGDVTLAANTAALRAVGFDGSNLATITNLQNGRGTDYFSTINYTKPDGSTGFNYVSAYEFWIKPSSVNGTQYLFTKDTVKANAGFIGISIQNGKLVYEFKKNDANVGPYTLTSNNSIPANVWTHIEASYYDSALHVFINGQPEGRLQTPNPFFTPFYYDPITNRNVNPDFFVGGLGRQFRYNGEMDELRVWATKRDATAIQPTINAIVDPSTTGLGLYYRFDGDVSESATDISSSQRILKFSKPAMSIASSQAPIHYASYKWMPGGATAKTVVVPASGNTLYTLTVTDYKGTMGSDTFRVASRVSNSIDTVRLCANSFTWHGKVYTASTDTARWVGINKFGCDSIVTLHLTLYPQSAPVIAAPTKICIGSTATLSAAGFSSYVWLPNGETTPSIIVQPTTTTTYTLKATNAIGCQFSASKTIVVNVPSSFTEKITACVSYSWHGTTYTSSNDSATWVGVNAAGCDSVVTLNLLITPLPTPIIVSANGAGICAGDPLQITARASGKQLQLDGTSRVVADAMGVDPSKGFTLEGWVNFSNTGSIQSIISQTAGNTPLPFDAWLNANGTVGFAVGNGYASSSITTSAAISANKWAHLAFVYSNKTISVYIDGVSGSNGAAVIPVAGKLNNFMIGNNASLSRPMVGAVDEIRVWNLALTQSQISGSMNSSVKPGNEGLVAYYKFDEADDELPVNAARTSNTATVVGSASHSTSTAPLVYQSYNWTSGFTTPVITATDPATLYTLRVTDVNGCSASVSGKAVVSTPNTFVEVVKACGSYTWHGTTYTASNNTAKWTTKNTGGCDSVVTLNLTISKPSASIETATACGYFVWHGKSYTKSTNSATWIGTNSAGCDSVVTLNLAITTATERTETAVTCGSYRWHDSTYTTSTTTPVWYGVSKNGCDSIVHLDLTITELPIVKISALKSVSLCETDGVVLQNATKVFTKYATGVTRFSSELRANLNKQITGTPDTYPGYGDFATAWSTNNQKSGREFIELTYDNNQPINFIDIYETLNSGTVDTVYVKNPGTNTFEVVYSGTAEIYDKPLQNRITFPLTSYPVSTIRIAINSLDLPAQKSIDAVAIGLTNNNTYRWSDGSSADTFVAKKSGNYVLTATNEFGCSASDTINLVVPDPVKPMITADGPTAICGNGSVTLSATLGFASYKWSNGATTPSINVSQSGSYTVIVTTAGGCNSMVSDAVTTTVKPAPMQPSVEVINNCGSATLTATGPGTFLWSNGQTTPSITVTAAGTYTVSQTVNGCTSKVESATASPKEAPAKPVITANGPTSFYVGSQVTLQAPAGFASYKWSNGSTTPVINVSQSGSYSVQVTNSSGCISVASNATLVTVAPLPSALYVSHQDGSKGQGANNTIKPDMQLHNEGNTTVSYKDVTIRYWLTVEDFAPMTNLFVDYAQLGTAKVKMKYVKLGQPRQGAYGYVEFSFDASAGTLAPGKNSGPIQSRVAKSDWTNFNESDDYSFAAVRNYTRNNRITVYQNGVLVGGTEPAVMPIVQRLKVYSQDKSNAANTNTIQNGLQLNNEGNVPVRYSDVAVRYWFTADGNQALKYTLDYSPLGNSAIGYRFQKLATPLNGADTYLELNYLLGDSLYPVSTTGNVQQRINKSDWSIFNQGNDHSYLANKILTENVRVTAYLKGQLVYGTEPGSTVAARLFQKQPSATSTPEVDLPAGPLELVLLSNPVTGPSINFLVKGAESKLVQVSIADAHGRVLVQKSLDKPGSITKQHISVNGVTNGILYLSVSTGSEQKTLKVIVNN